MYSPLIIATYAYELAQKFGTFYEKHRVIGALNGKEEARLLLITAFANTLKKSINLLGIDEVELM